MSSPSRRTPPQGTPARPAPSAATRHFCAPALTDPNRVVEWTVREIPALAIPGTRGRSCLVFASDEAVRRVWTFPATWPALSDAELLALSWTT